VKVMEQMLRQILEVVLDPFSSADFVCHGGGLDMLDGDDTDGGGARACSVHGWRWI
jgi:hypothetical protein